MLTSLFILLIQLYSAYTQGCLNHLGQAVDWWVVLKVPPKIGKSGFGYYDSTYSHYTFNYVPTHADDAATNLFATLQQINTFSLETVAWNDQKPTGQTSTTLAHSKGLISYSSSTKKGFLLSHSLPKYPAFDNHKVNITIASAENYYGQHLLCVSMSLNELNKLAYRLLITRPYIYESNIKNSTATAYLANLAASQSQRVSNDYQTEDYNPVTGVTIKGVFKNGFNNCSIFEDALIQTLKVNLTAQTWGRPLEKAWCTPSYSVNNVIMVGVGGISWNQQDDHSKWVLAGTSYACFGDMNRMSSQWKRGGSFFCLNKPSLVQALKNTILQKDSC